MAQNFLTDRDVAARLSVSRPTVWRWVREGNLPRPVALSERTKRWPLTVIEGWEQERMGAA